MTHAIHKLPRRIFGDDCEECVERASSIEGLFALDGLNRRKLGRLAEELHELKQKGEELPEDVSYADLAAVDHLRTAARITYASGISWEAAR